jgi:hypothetical protein
MEIIKYSSLLWKEFGKFFLIKRYKKKRKYKLLIGEINELNKLANKNSYEKNIFIIKN